MSVIYVLLPLVLFFLFLKRWNLDAITYNDGFFYDKEIDPNFYFIERLNQKTEPTPEVNRVDKKESDTSRVLKNAVSPSTERKNEENVLVLKENLEGENMPPPNNPNDIKLHNNFLNRTDETQSNNDEIVRNEDNQNKNDNPQAVFNYKKVTYNDYLLLYPTELFDYDKRKFGKYFWDELVQYHSIIRIIFKRSLLEPSYVISLKVTFKINLIFALNAISLTDDMIENRANDPSRVIFI
jgi:hypothetical protein